MAVAQRILEFAPLADWRSDRTLVRAAQAGKAEAASVLIERYYPRVRAFISYLTGGGSSVDDLTQEAFTRALAALGRFNGNYRFGPWVYRIAKNLCIDEARRSNFRPEPADPAELTRLEAIPESSDNVWESISSQIASSVVRKALDHLPWRQKAALILKEIEGLSYSEISEVIGSGVRGVEATLRRARTNFRMAVARVEEAEVEQALCLRTLRGIAGDPTRRGEFRGHLRTCSSCRSRASSLVSADKLLGMLPPFVAGAPGWKPALLERVAGKSVPRRGILEVLRGHPSMGLASPVTQIAQYAATLAVTASVSVASVTGALRVAVASGAPDAAATLESEEVSYHRPRSGPRTGSGPAAPVPADPGEARAAPAEAPAIDVDEARLGLTARLSELYRPIEKLVADIASQAGSQAGAPAPKELPAAPPQPEAPAGAVLPAPVLLPRRKPHSH